jgi:agmatine deiminase
VTTPRAQGFHQPAEWAPHLGTLLAWPSAEDLWQDNLPGAQAGVIALAEGIADYDAATGLCRGERLFVLCPTAEREAEARRHLAHLPATFLRIPFGDIWLRDIAPIGLVDASGAVGAVAFRFNGWGEKYVLPHDASVADAVASKLAHAGLARRFDAPMILEGGSVDVDGEGTLLTTSQCLENTNRGPVRPRSAIDADLREWLGVEKVLWITEGLANDHTDGHIDTLARFVAPGRVCAMAPREGRSERGRCSIRLLSTSSRAADALGRKLELVDDPVARPRSSTTRAR